MIIPNVVQKWYSASRAINTWYRNTEATPIWVAITYAGRGGAAFTAPTQTTTNALVYSHGGAGAVAQDLNDTPYIGFIVPPSYWYYLEGSGLIIMRWSELRTTAP
jgi:hypothetical protein